MQVLVLVLLALLMHACSMKARASQNIVGQYRGFSPRFCPRGFMSGGHVLPSW